MVGDILRRERERQKLSVKDIEQATSIRALYIEAIENGEYDKLPGNVYTKGFIKNYGNFLKLEGDALSKQFIEEIAPTPVIIQEEIKDEVENQTVVHEEAPIQKNEVKDETTTIIKETIPNINHLQSVEQKEIKVNHKRASSGKSNGNFILVAVVMIAVIAGGLWYYFNNIEGTEVAQNQNDVSQVTSNSTVKPASVPDTVHYDGINLQAKFHDSCWTRVVVDGRLAYEGTAEAGQSLDWQATNQINVTVGNANAIEFVENGKALGRAGAEGEVIEKTFVRR